MTSLSRILLALCLALSPLGCGTNISCGGGPDEPTTLPTGAPSAIAILASQIDWSAGSSSSSSGGDVDSGTLYVMIGSPAPACADPFGSSASCGPAFSVSIGIPPALQQPGTLALNSGVTSTFSEMEAASSATPAVCPVSGGSFTDGTLEIVSIDAAQVVVTLSGTMMFAGDDVPDEVANGTYTALRCP